MNTKEFIESVQVKQKKFDAFADLGRFAIELAKKHQLSNGELAIILLEYTNEVLASSCVIKNKEG